MNLHAQVAGQIGAVNPFVPGIIRVNTGSATARDGLRTPTYTDVPVTAQVQALTFKDLQQLDGVNMNGVRRGIYFFGAFNAVVRPTEKGGDLIVLTGGANAGTWLTAQVIEQWSDGAIPTWCKVAATLQNGA